MKNLHQYSIVCIDSDGNHFRSFTKAESKKHARSIVQDRIRRKVCTTIKTAFGDGMTEFKAIFGKARRVQWSMPSL